MTIGELLHNWYVYGRHIRILAHHLAEVLPTASTVLSGHSAYRPRS
jgi:hypothetical protein